MPARQMFDYPKLLGSESITVSTVAVGLTTIPIDCVGAKVYVESANIRFWYDTSAPTASVGIPAVNGALIDLENANEVRGFQAIRSGSSDATLRVTYLM